MTTTEIVDSELVYASSIEEIHRDLDTVDSMFDGADARIDGAGACVECAESKVRVMGDMAFDEALERLMWRSRYEDMSDECLVALCDSGEVSRVWR